MKTECIRVVSKEGNEIDFYFTVPDQLLFLPVVRFRPITLQTVKYLRKHLPLQVNDLLKWYERGFKVLLMRHRKPFKVPFFIFWEVYGKKVKKQATLKLWSKTSLKRQQSILEVLSEYNQYQTEKQFRPYPDKFLREKLWDDEDFITEAKAQHTRKKAELKVGERNPEAYRARQRKEGQVA